MSTSTSLTFTPNRLSFSADETYESVYERTITVKSNELETTLLLRFNVITGRFFPYQVSPNVAFLSPNEELVVTVTRGSIEDKDPEGEWRDVLGVEAILAHITRQPGDQEALLQGDETLRRIFWSEAVRTGKQITSWLIPIDHAQSFPSEIEAVDEDAAAGGGVLSTWREVEKPGNWYRFYPVNSTWLSSQLPPESETECSVEGPPVDVDYTTGHFSALFWRPVEHRSAQECVVRFNDSEDIFHVKMAMKWMIDVETAVPPGDGTPRSLIGRTLQELSIWKDLHHDNIAPLVGFVLWPNIGFLSPYYPNGRILSYIENEKCSWEERVRLMDEIASALIYLHEEKRIVYGDLKEDNVLIDHNGHAILIDFGLSMTEADAQSTPSFTGHIRYLAPEVPEGKHKLPASDVYAYGLLILEIAIGRRARGEDGMDHVAAANAYYFPTLRPEHYPEFRYSKSNALWNLITECTQRIPKRRPRMREVRRTLSRVSQRDWMPNALPM